MDIDHAEGNLDRIRRISQHISACIGKPESVFHENDSHKVHIDIHMVKASERFPFHVLVTSGMSNLPMMAPKGAEGWRFSELYLALPPSWPLSSKAWEDEIYYWPIRTLKFVARYPHVVNSWISLGHTLTLTEGSPPKPLHESTKMNHIAILPPILIPDSFHKLEIESNHVIHFCAVVPIFQEELVFARQNRAQELFARLKEQGVSEVLDPGRKSVI